MGLMAQILGVIKAVGFTILHPFDTFNVTVVRRYVDAQGHYIGELYDGDSRTARMIGYSCDNWPLDADVRALPMHPRVCWSKSFLDPLPSNTLRVGAMEPVDNADVQAYVAMRRWCPLRIVVLNRFVEHVMGDTI